MGAVRPLPGGSWRRLRCCLAGRPLHVQRFRCRAFCCPLAASDGHGRGSWARVAAASAGDRGRPEDAYAYSLPYSAAIRLRVCSMVFASVWARRGIFRAHPGAGLIPRVTAQRKRNNDYRDNYISLYTSNHPSPSHQNQSGDGHKISHKTARKRPCAGQHVYNINTRKSHISVIIQTANC